MFTESAALYDLIYAQFKNYSDEAAPLDALLRRVHPLCHSILDVASGTGEHMRHLANAHGFQVDGLDLDRRFLDTAARRNPGGRVWEAGMRAFDLAERYGAVVVEPWFAPGQLDAAYVMRNVAETPELRVERVRQTEIVMRLSRLQFNYTLTDASGVRHATEVHQLRRVRTVEMLAAVARAVLHATYEEPSLDGRGIHIGYRAA